MDRDLSLAQGCVLLIRRSKVTGVQGRIQDRRIFIWSHNETAICSVSIDFPLQIKESHRRNGELRVFDRNPNLFLNLINSFLNQNNAWWKKRLHRQTPLQKMRLNQTQTNTFFTYTVCAQFHSWHTMTCNLEENEALKQSKRKGWEQDEALTLDKQWRAAVCFSVSEYSTITPSSATQPIKALRTSSVAWRLLPWLR